MTDTEPSGTPVTTTLPSAFVQEQIWFQEQWTPRIGVYNIPTALRLRGPLNEMALKRGLEDLVRRHEPLRTCFVSSITGVSQVICEPRPVVLPKQSVRDEKDLAERLREESRRPFDLKRDLLLRAALFHVNDGNHVLLITMHHIASDEWSVRVMLQELKELYCSHAAKRTPVLPELPIQYADYAQWQREWLRGTALQEQLKFWKEQLKEEPSPIDFPLDRPRPVTRSYSGERRRAHFSPAISRDLTALARSLQTTVFTVLFAGYQALLARYTNQNDILTGTVVAGRNRTETEGLIGFFVNLLAIRMALPESITVRELVRTVKEQTLKVFAHADVPFDRVVAQLCPNRTANLMPLIQTVFTVQNQILEKATWDGLEVEWVDVYTATSKFDLGVTVEQTASGLCAVVEYNVDVFDSSTIQQFLRHYEVILANMTTNPDGLVWKLPLLSPEERQLVLSTFNATETDYPRNKSIGELFTEQAAATPHAMALSFEAEEWSYAELRRRANALARILDSLGVAEEVKVGVCLERSADLIVALLATVQAGGCYVPLDPEYPEERLHYLIEDSQTPILLTHLSHLSKLKGATAKVIALDDPDITRQIAAGSENPLQKPISPESAAYAMYTSGSTGRPKGVVVTHRNVIRLVRNTNYAELRPDEVYLQYAPISFDASTFEIWAPLLNGGKLCIMPPSKVSLEELGDVIRSKKITTLWLTTGLFNLMIQENIEPLKGLRQLLTGGDTASLSHFQKFLAEVPNCRLIHCYGPTENTTFTTCCDIRPADLANGFVPIGKPISNTQVYILDGLLQPTPLKVAGELFTSGDGLAREYLHAPELTAQKFIPHPFRDGERLYRTGDRARFLPDGTVQFLGRADHQLKIRGFRIEPGEIEHALESHPAIKETALIARTEAQGDKRLIAYWTSRPGIPLPNSEQLRLYLKDRLPDFMIPSGFVHLEKMPLDPNGKIDRNALRARSDVPESAVSVAAPRDSIEETLVNIWREVLKLETVGINDDFFSLGGHSLLATQVISRVKQRLNVQLPLRVMFDCGTIAEMAAAAREHKNGRTAADAKTPVSPSS
jgi:amino acid adenylation domain-containing protein